MKRAAIGIRAHSGWGAAVTAAGAPGGVEAMDRRRIAVALPKFEGATQPYHLAREMDLAEAERFIADCAAVSERLAFEGLGRLIEDARSHGHSVVGCAIVLGAGRPLPLLPQILAAHSLIHTAEGEFFRKAFRTAAERLGLPVTGIPERELETRASSSFGPRASSLLREIALLGRSIGPPWTADQKTATLAAVIALGAEAEPVKRRLRAHSGR